MTRIEKWKQYRDEINQISFLNDSVSEDEKKIASYTTKISKINRSILTAINNKQLELIPGTISVDAPYNKIPTDITNSFDSINKLVINSNIEKINNYFHNKINYSILDPSNNSLDINWLKKHKEYNEFNETIKNKSNEVTNKDILVKDLTNKYKVMAEKSTLQQPNKIAKMDFIERKNSTKKIAISMISVSLAAILAVIILIFIKGFGG